MLKKLLFKTTNENSSVTELSMTLLRIGAGLLMLVLHGLGKIPPSEKFIEGVSMLGFPFPIFFAWLAAITEVIGALFLAVGFLTRPSAFLLSITMLVAAFGRHFSDPLNVKEMSLLYLFVFLIFAVKGAGRWSIDRFIK